MHPRTCMDLAGDHYGRGASVPGQRRWGWQGAHLVHTPQGPMTSSNQRAWLPLPPRIANRRQSPPAAPCLVQPSLALLCVPLGSMRHSRLIRMGVGQGWRRHGVTAGQGDVLVQGNVQQLFWPRAQGLERPAHRFVR